MKKKILSIFTALAIVLASLSTTSCYEILNLILPELFGQIISVNAIGIDHGAIVSWSNGSISSYRLFVSYVKTYGTGNPVEIEITENNNYTTINGLDNDVNYTFKVYIKDSNGDIADYKTATATPSANSSRTYQYNSSTGANSFIELPADTSVITLTGVNGKTITYANVNKSTSSAIPANSVRKYMENAGTGGISTSVISRSADSDEDFELLEMKAPEIKSFVPPEDDEIKIIQPKNRAGTDSGTFNKNAPQLGQTRLIYVDQDPELNTYSQEEMTLYAIGKKTDGSGEIKSLVWVNEANVASVSSGNKISTSVIEDIINKFTHCYALEEEIFGQTSDRIIVKNGTVGMVNYPTSTYINIVLTDIGKDFNTSSPCGVVGYFWSRDYYDRSYSTNKTIKTSNEGKYFYIDIPFCNYTSSNTYAGTGGVSNTALSTLFHEYQHMINFNQKDILHDKSTGDHVWYNEMLSMLCEDLMQDALGIPDNENIQKSRIPNFNGYYYYSGVAQYISQDSWISYGTAYAFGAWLARNYGGAKLVKEMSTNAYVGIESVVNAVNEVNSTTMTWDDLLKEYLQATGFRASYAGSKTLPTLNKRPDAETAITKDVSAAEYIYKTPTGYDSGTTTPETLTGQFKKGINLWKSDYRNVSSSKYYYGPMLAKVGFELDLQPTGFIFHPIGTATSNSVTLYFTPSASTSGDSVYIYIQDSFSATRPDTTLEDDTQ